MTWILENFEYIVIILMLIMIIIILIVLVYTLHVSRFFSNRKFRIIGRYEYEPLTETKEFVIQVFNNNVNDSRLVGFGFMYKEQTIDYFKTYHHEKKLELSNQLMVLSRDSFKLNVASSVLETIIADYNLGKKRISKICVYATDAQGIVTKANANNIRRIVAKDLKKAFLAKRQLDKENKKKQRLERKQEKKNERKLKRLNRRENLKKWWLIVKTKLKRKPKSYKANPFQGDKKDE